MGDEYGEPDIQIEDEGFDVILEEEGVAQEDARIKELADKNAELMEQIKSFQAPKTGGDQFGDLAKAIRELQTPQKEEVKGVDYSSIVESVRKDFFQDPTKSVLSLLQPVAQEIQANADKRLAAQAKQISKLTALSTPGDKDLLVRYGDEVEKLVGSLPPSEEVYQQALKQVKMNHLEELISEKANEIAQEALVKVEGNLVKNGVKGPSPDLSNLPRKSVKKVSMTATQVNNLKDWGMTKGYDWDDPEDRSFIIEYAQGKGWVK